MSYDAEVKAKTNMEKIISDEKHKITTLLKELKDTRQKTRTYTKMLKMMSAKEKQEEPQQTEQKDG